MPLNMKTPGLAGSRKLTCQRTRRSERCINIHHIDQFMVNKLF